MSYLINIHAQVLAGNKSSKYGTKFSPLHHTVRYGVYIKDHRGLGALLHLKGTFKKNPSTLTLTTLHTTHDQK